MSGISERDVMRRLRSREHEEVEPPGDLLARLKADIPAIPAEIRLVPPVGAAGNAGKTVPRRRRSAPTERRWLLAASLAATVLAGLLAWRLMGRLPGPGSEAALVRHEGAEPAPQSAAAPPPTGPQADEPLAGEDDSARQNAREITAGAAAPTPAAPEAAAGRTALNDLYRKPEAAPSEPAASVPQPLDEAYEERITVDAESPRDEPLFTEDEISEQPAPEQTAPPAAAARPAPPPPAPPIPSREALRRRADAPAARQEKEKKDLRALGYVGGVEGGVVGGVAGGTPAGSPDTAAGNVAIGTNLSDQEVDKLSDARKTLGNTASTGGTAEPDDQPFGDVFFRSAGVNPFVDTDEDRLSTFGLDVDTASYTVARHYLSEGHLPPPEAVRVEEFVNFFHYGDRPPAHGDFALRAEGAPTPFAAGDRYRLLRFSLRARQVSERARRPAVLTFVVDVSGSMDQGNRLGLVKKALGLLLDHLRADDRVGLVIYGSRGEVLLEPTSDHGAIHRAIDLLQPGGSTNAEEGLTLAYRVADRAFRAGAVNRLVLCSDGVANVGATGPDSILARIGTAARRGIELTTVGFGMGNLNDHLMEQLADRGDGRYVYVDTLEEARRVFVEDLTGTLQTVAKDAKVQVEFNPRTVARYRLLGYENRDVADDRFRDDTVDAGEIGAGHGVTALYEVKLQPGIADPREGRAHGAMDLAILRLRYRSTESNKVVESSRHLAVGELAPTWEQATPALRLAAVTAELAELLRGSYWAKDGSFDALFRRAQTLSATFAGNSEGADVAELVSLIGKAARLKDQGRK